MRKNLTAFVCWLLLSGSQAVAQDYLLNSDSLNVLLKTTHASLSPEKIKIVTELMSRQLPGDSVFESLKNGLIEEAEVSRDRSLLCMTYLEISAKYLNYNQRPDYYEKGKFYADKGLLIANEAGLNAFKVAAFLAYARYHANNVQYQKALDYNNQAIALASAIGSDSLLSLSYSAIADTWDILSNKLSEFQALLNMRDFAEKSKVHELIIDSYYSLGHFYEYTTDYEKAKDYYALSIQRGRTWKANRFIYKGLVGFGRIYFKEKNENLGLVYYGKALHFSDSLGIAELRLQINFDLLNYYFNNGSPIQGIVYMNNHPQMVKFIKDLGIEYQLNKLYAELQRKRGNYDSALYFLHVAAPFEYGQQTNFGEKYSFTMQMAAIYDGMHRTEAEKNTLLLAKNFADSSQDLDNLKDVTLQLDSVFEQLGDFKTAQLYLHQFDMYRDSLETLSKQKDLLNIEIENANKRADQQKLDEAETTRLRNNLEYMGITAALATVFIVLVILGVFKISPSVIKALGFFAFIFLFEFIVLLLDEQIQALTHGEPWKVLGVKIIIIAMLLPLHHWLEEKMMHYLTNRAHKIRPKIFDRKAV